MNTLIKSVFVVFCLSFCCLPCCAACPSADLTGDCRVDLADFAVLANQWLTVGTREPNGMVWVYVSEPNFTGQMSKYETTNAQYCQFLNAALASGDIYIQNNDAVGSNGSNPGADFVGYTYYHKGPGFPGSPGYGMGSGKITYSGGTFTVDPNFENHPVTYVSWYGATAFCNYYGYRLPTEWEWQALADFNGSYTYGCGKTITVNLVNYNDSYHPYGTTVVGSFGAYGYGLCDMSGNLDEWVSTLGSDLRGGSFAVGASMCAVSERYNSDLTSTSYTIGFRACR